MSLHLDSPRRIGNTVIAALSVVNISASPKIGQASFTGSKSPVAILFKRGKKYAAVDNHGALLTRKKIEKRYPGILAKFKKSSKGGG